MINYWIEPNENNLPYRLWIRIPKIYKGENVFYVIKTTKNYQPNGYKTFDFFINTSLQSPNLINVENINQNNYFISPNNNSLPQNLLFKIDNFYNYDLVLTIKTNNNTLPISLQTSVTNNLLSNERITYESNKLYFIDCLQNKNEIQTLNLPQQNMYNVKYRIYKDVQSSYYTLSIYVNNSNITNYNFVLTEPFNYLLIGSQTEPVNFQLYYQYTYKVYSNINIVQQGSKISIYSPTELENVVISVPTQNINFISSINQSLNIVMQRKNLPSPIILDSFNNVIKQQIGYQSEGMTYIENNDLIEVSSVISLTNENFVGSLWSRVYSLDECVGNKYYIDFDNYKIILGRPVQQNEVVIQYTYGSSIFDGIHTISGIPEFITNSEEDVDRTKIAQLKIINTEQDKICSDIKIKQFDFLESYGQSQNFTLLSLDGQTWENEIRIDKLLPNEEKVFYVKTTIDKDFMIGRYNDTGLIINSYKEKGIVKYNKDMYNVLQNSQDIYISFNNTTSNTGKQHLSLQTNQQFNVTYNNLPFQSDDYYQVFNGINTRVRVLTYDKLKDLYFNKSWAIQFNFYFTGNDINKTYCLYSYGFGYKNYYETQEITGHRCLIQYKQNKWFLLLHQYYTYTSGKISDTIIENVNNSVYSFRRGNEGYYGVQIIPNTWYSVIIQYNNYTKKLSVYINSYLMLNNVEFNNPTIWNQYDNEPFTIGQYTYDNQASEGPQSLFYQGYIKDFMFFSDRILTPEEINILSNKYYYLRTGMTIEQM